MRITHGTFDLAREADIQKMVDEQLIPELKSRPGFQAYYGGVDRAAGTLVAVTVWDTLEHATAVEASRAPMTAGLGMELEDARIFEVRATA